MAARQLTPAANTGVQADEGYAHYHCAELRFGAAVRVKPASTPPMPDTVVRWEARGDPTKLGVYTSIDDGRTWQRVERSGDPIPKLGFSTPTDGSSPIYSAAAAATTNRRVLARFIFLDGGPGVVVDNVEIAATREARDEGDGGP